MDSIIKKVKYTNRNDCILKKNKINECKKNWIIKFKTKDFQYDTGNYDIVFCKECKLGFTNPYPTEETVKYFYSSRSSLDFPKTNLKFIYVLWIYFAKMFVKKISSNINPKYILDYSCGNGIFSKAATNVYKDAIIDAVDFQNDPPELIKNNKNINYYSIDNFKNNKTKYDLIILRHVLEHTYNPEEIILYLKNKLNINGLLHIEVPNLDSGGAKIFRKYWQHYVPQHIMHFTKESLIEICKKVGFTNIKFNKSEIPNMGNIFNNLLNIKKQYYFKPIITIIFHPIQLLIEKLFFSSSCISVNCILEEKA